MKISKKHLLVAAVATVLSGGLAPDVLASQASAPEVRMTEAEQTKLIQQVSSPEMLQFIKETVAVNSANDHFKAGICLACRSCKIADFKEASSRERNLDTRCAPERIHYGRSETFGH